MRDLRTLALAAIAGMLTISAQAQTDLFLTGTLTDPNWSPGAADEFGDTGLDNNVGLTAEDYRFTDNGDGTYTLTLNTTDMGLTAANSIAEGEVRDYKIAGTDFDPDPLNNNAKFVVPAEGTEVTWTYNTNPQDDGFSPDGTGNGLEKGGGFLTWTGLDTYITSQSSIQATGNFQDELGGTDFDPAGANAVTMVDDGSGDDEAPGDGIYTGSVSNLPLGTYEFKIVFNQTFADGEIGDVGFGGGNIFFDVVFENDTMVIELDSETARTRVTSSQEDSIPTNGLYVVSSDSAFPTVFDDTRRMAPNTDYQAQIITVPTAGTYSLGLWDTADGTPVGRDIPETGAVPFTTTTDNQDILVVLDEATYTDGYSPETGFVVVLDAVTRDPLNSWEKIQPVGNFQNEISAAIGEFDANAAALDLVDDGGANDISAAGDNIYSNTFNTALGESIDSQVKAVARRTGLGDTGFTIQMGGVSEALTINGNNEAVRFDFSAATDYTFGVDAVNGRIGVADASTKALGLPDRSAEYLSSGVTPNTDPTATVQDWTLY